MKDNAKQVLTPAQTKEAKAFFTANANAHVKGAEKWAAIRAMFIIAGIEITELKTALAVLNRDTWLTLAEGKKGAPLDATETKRIRNVANADFSRGVADPEAKERKAREAEAKKAADALAVKQAIVEAAKAAAKSETSAIEGHTASMAAPSTVRRVEELRDSMNVLQGELMAYQTELSETHMPKQIKTELSESIGLITQHVADATNQVIEVLKLLG